MATEPVAMSEAKKTAFEKCKAARAAALERKREAKEAAKNPPPEPEPVPEPEPAPPAERAPTPRPSPVTSVEDEEEEEFDVIDPQELINMINEQSKMIESLHNDVRGMKTHQEDLSTSFATHGVKQQHSLNFV